MTKAEFLSTLRSKLMGEVSTVELENTIRYYDEYITDAVNNGKPEEAVLTELGSPLLIAKTIIDTAGKDVDGPDRVFTRQTEGQEGGSEPNSGYHRYEVNSWKSKLTIIAVIVVVLLLVFTILRVLIPILIPLLVIWFIVSMFRNGGRR